VGRLIVRKGKVMRDYILKEGCAISEKIKSVDWDNSPLGPMETWPNSLKTTLNLCLNSPTPMLISWGPELIMLYNEAYSAFVDDSNPSIAIGKPTKVFWSDIWDKMGPLLENVKREGVPVSLEDQFFPLYRNGVKEDRYFSFSYSPIKDEEGIRGIITIVHETTGKVLGNLRIHQEKERLKLFFNQTPVAICILGGPKMVFELVNPTYQQLFPGRDLLGKELLKALPEIKDTPIHHILLNVYKTGETFEGKELLVRLAKFDGAPLEELYFNFIYQAKKNVHNNVDGIMVFAYEVNDVVRAKKQSELSYRRFEKLANTLPQVVWTADPDGELDYFNDRWFSYSGLTYEQSVNGGWISTIHPDDLPTLLKAWDKAVKTGDPYQMEARIRNAENIYQWSLIRALPIKDEEEAITQWCGTSTLIQDQKKSEQEIIENNEELIYLNNELTQVNADLDNFIYVASHDLKTPISNIEGLINALTDHLPPQILENPLVTRLLQMGNTSIERFNKTIEELSDITKLQRIKDDEMEMVDIQEIVNEIQEDLSLIIEETKGQINLELHDVQKFKFSCRNLRSILYNLISNSLKYKSKERNPVIVISGREETDYQVVTVQDNGLGMDPSKKDSIFGMFKRLHNHVEGSGIGLYIVKKIMDNAGGKIEVESLMGKGSKVKLFFKKSL
jgi:signal transduction histidine kinase